MKWLFSAVLGLLLAGCLPIPNLRADLRLPAAPYRLAPAAVRATYVSLPGYPVPGTPARFNRTFYLRYSADEVTTKAAKTVLILMPGIFGGATNLDILARQLVAGVPGLEVWAVDRRANALEDHSAFTESLRTGDPDVAYRYYVQNAGTAAGFTPIPPDDVSFMRRWGLVAHLNDLHGVVNRAHEVAETVMLGGHSLGASLVSLYAAYRFDDGLGADGLDGLVLLDGTLGRTGAFGLTKGVALGGLELLPNSLGFDAGRGWPYLPVAAGPEYYAEVQARAVLARFKPDARAPDSALPLTNLAYLGVQDDEDYGLSATFSASLGEVVGARYGGNLPAVIIDGWGSHGSRTVAGAADGYELITWSAGDPAREHTDIRAFVRSRMTLATDYNEWYFPLRLLVDLSELPLNLAEQDDFVAHSEVTVPTLAVGAGRGLVQSLDDFSAYSNLRASALFSSYIVPDYTHLDIVNARANPVAPLFARWAEQITQLRRSE